jgi:chemotaxis response regulator CheB
VIRVLIADDQALVRGAFRMMLESEPDIGVVAEAADGREAVEQAKLHKPDVPGMRTSISRTWTASRRPAASSRTVAARAS